MRPSSCQGKVARSFYGNASILPADAEGGCVFRGDIPLRSQYTTLSLWRELTSSLFPFHFVLKERAPM